MMNNLTIRARLIALSAIALAFIVILGAFAIYGLNKSADAIKEIGWNRMPSVIGLMDMSRGQLETRVRNRSVFVYADETNAQQKFADLAEKKKEAYKLIEEGKNVYEPLPQSSEEVGPWKILMDNYKPWLAANSKLDDIMLQLSRNSDPEVQKRLVHEFKEVLDTQNDPLLQITQKSLNQLIDINKRIANETYLASSAAVKHRNQLITGAIVLILALLAALAYAITRSITSSLRDMKDMITRIEHDNDFTQQIPIHGKNEISDTAHAFNSLVQKMNAALKQIMGKVDQLNSSAESLSTASQQVAKSSGYQSEATSSMAASVEEMSVSIDHVSENAKEALNLSENAGKISSDGGMAIRKTVDEMNVISEVAAKTSNVILSLGEQSAQISTIVSTIREVAEQTNLLALNAAIEAARAGEQGRGFAVVADEVRKLAERTSRSTEEIARMVEDIQGSTGNAVSSMKAMVDKVNNGKELATQGGTYIQEIQESTKRAMMAVQDITNALKEQSIASQTIAQSVEQIAQMTDENSAAAGATSETAENLEKVALEIASTVKQFKV